MPLGGPALLFRTRITTATQITAMAESPAIPPTLLSAIQETSMPDNIQTSGDKTVAFLHSLLNTTARVAQSVTLHSTTAVNDSRTVSLLREQSTGQHLLHLVSLTSPQSRTQVAKTISAAQERRRSDTWYDGPSDDSSTLARISAWSSAVGMQAFPEAAAGTLVLGGKVLVLDVALIPEPTVHASYAGSAEGRDSPTMDAFFSRLVSGVSKGGDGRRLRDALGYLMRLDELAAHEGNGGARWFSEVDVLAKELAKFTQAEAACLAQVTRSQSVPLDVLLLRGHALGLPYLHSPTLCFLVYLSPRAYLSLQRSAPATTSAQTQPLTTDIPSTHLYNCLSGDHPPIGVTRATLTLVPLSALPHTPPSSADPLLSGRPSFPLVPNAIGFSYDFPLPAGPDAGKYGWVLAFGAGIVISHGRCNPTSCHTQAQGQACLSGTADEMVFQLNSEGALLSERYTATYVSPTNMHPPLRLTLTAPDEPGFLLERVQIVREQCWLNEILNGIAWMPEVVAGPPIGDSPEAETTEEELRALLSGTYTPLSIPVNVYVAPAAVVLSFPERPPMPGMVSISVLLNGLAGATVEVQGAMGADVQMATLEEAVRRGGALGLPGRVWAASQTAP
ncbi:hypothetical protein H4582DRAFT_2111791 [Lactarius indigo]|nr:hypothetical protein H4582DRAFT_2111791 [Lactarius indigo]